MSGRAVLITGPSRGIGLATALASGALPCTTGQAISADAGMPVSRF